MSLESRRTIAIVNTLLGTTANVNSTTDLATTLSSCGVAVLALPPSVDAILGALKIESTPSPVVIVTVEHVDVPRSSLLFCRGGGASYRVYATADSDDDCSSSSSSSGVAGMLVQPPVVLDNLATLMTHINAIRRAVVDVSFVVKKPQTVAAAAAAAAANRGGYAADSAMIDPNAFAAPDTSNTNVAALRASANSDSNGRDDLERIAAEVKIAVNLENAIDAFARQTTDLDAALQRQRGSIERLAATIDVPPHVVRHAALHAEASECELHSALGTLRARQELLNRLKERIAQRELQLSAETADST